MISIVISNSALFQKALREREAEIRGLIETVCDSQQNGIQMRHDMCNNIASSSQQVLI